MTSARSRFDLEPNALARALARARAEDRPVLDLTVSNPTRAGIPYPREAILGALADPGSMIYEPAPFGLPSARAEVAATLSVAPERIVLTASTSEAYSFLFKLLCDPGDEALVPAPSYPLFDHLARLEGVRLVPYRLAYDGAWHVDLDSVRRAIGLRTRAILVVSPNNPTGSFLKRDELAALAATGLPIISDEVFATYPFVEDVRRASTALEADGSLVFALGGLSKLAALPQLKAAWIAVGGPETIAQPALERLEVIADAFLSVGAPVQHALGTLLGTREIASAAIARRTRENLARLRAALPGSPATLLHLEGGWYATLRLPRVRSEEAYVVGLLEQAGVYVHPGSFFDFPDEAHVVLSLLTPERELDEGVRRLIHHVARWAS